MMTRAISTYEGIRPLTDPEEAELRRQYTDPYEDSIRADAEAEEIAELWAGDPGNQGS